jgi:hypothetical protein
MSIESLRLECLLEKSVDRVANAVTSVLRREGWRPTNDEQHSEAREVRVASKSGWVVVDELDGVGTEISWVAIRLSFRCSRLPRSTTSGTPTTSSSSSRVRRTPRT